MNVEISSPVYRENSPNRTSYRYIEICEPDDEICQETQTGTNKKKAVLLKAMGLLFTLLSLTLWISRKIFEITSNFITRNKPKKSSTFEEQQCLSEIKILESIESASKRMKPSHKKNLQITILLVGTHGDVQPFVALAMELIRQGHGVRIATHEAHRELVQSHGVEFYLLPGNPRELMELCVDNGMFSPSFLKKAWNKFRGFVHDLLKESWNACSNSPDLIIQNPAAFGGVHIAERLGVPIIQAFTMPWTQTGNVPHPFVIPSVPLGSFYNFASYWAVETGMWLMMKSMFNDFRQKTLELPSLGIGGGRICYDRKVRTLYCWSPSVLPKPSDWSDNDHVSGYWFLERNIDWTPPEDLLAFLNGHPKPIYIGFGSSTISDPQSLVNMIIDAVERTGQRAIIGRGWGLDIQKTFPSNLFVIESVPHLWLFPRVSAIIHHGGAGTTAAGFRAGVPAMAVPFFGDQFLWGTRIEQMGVGLSPIPLKSLTGSKLKDAIFELTTNSSIRFAAEALGQRIRKENGIDDAIDFLHETISQHPRKNPYAVEEV